MKEIERYHAHVYYDESSFERAVTLFEEAAETFSLTLGKFHRKSIGPHLSWNCSFTFNKEQFGEIVPWLAMNRHGLSLLIHCLSGDDLKDHTDHAMWMGKLQNLNLGIFHK